MVIPNADGNITQVAKDQNIAHIAPVYVEDPRLSPPMNLKYKLSVFIFNETKNYNPSVGGQYVC